MSECKNCSTCSCRAPKTPDRSVNVSPYTPDSVSFEIDSLVWNTQGHYYSIALTAEEIKLCPVGEPIKEMLTSLSSVNGIKLSPVILRRKGFIVSVKNHTNTITVIAEIQAILERIYHATHFNLHPSFSQAIVQ